MFITNIRGRGRNAHFLVSASQRRSHKLCNVKKLLSPRLSRNLWRRSDKLFDFGGNFSLQVYLLDKTGLRRPEYFASTSRRRVNWRTSSEGMASTATVRVSVIGGGTIGEVV